MVFTHLDTRRGCSGPTTGEGGDAQRFRDTEHIDNLDARKKAAGWAITAESRPRLDALLYLAQAEQPIADAGTGWDADSFLLACPNGVVDLETGLLRAGRQADGLTMQTTVAFDAAATCSRFERCLDEVFAGDRDTPSASVTIRP